MDLLSSTELEELWITEDKDQETETPLLDGQETIPQLKSGLLNQSDTEITFISEISKETNV
jgi:hypothetical protein